MSARNILATFMWMGILLPGLSLAGGRATAAVLTVENDFVVPITVLFKPSSQKEWQQVDLAVAASTQFELPDETVDIILRTAAGNEYHRYNLDVNQMVQQAGGGTRDVKKNFRWGAWLPVVTPQGPSRQFVWRDFPPTHFSFNIRVNAQGAKLSRTPLYRTDIPVPVPVSPGPVVIPPAPWRLPWLPF